MQTLESGQNKIKEITEKLRRDTLEPAEKEAAHLVEEGRAKANQLVAEGEKRAKELEASAKASIEKERAVFETALKQAGKQAIEALKEEIEEKLFDEPLGKCVAEASGTKEVIASILNTLIKAVEKEGSAADLKGAIGTKAKPQEVTELLLSEACALLKKGVSVGDFEGGARLSLIDQKVTLDMSDEALLELLKRYVRKDFRKALFG